MWFGAVEPPRTHGKQGVQGTYALVRGGSNREGSVMCLNHPELVNKQHEFGVVRTYRALDILDVVFEQIFLEILSRLACRKALPV